RQRTNALEIVLLDLTGKIAGLQEAKTAGQLGDAHPPGQLQQRKWISTGFCDDPVADALIQPARYHRGEQGARILIRETVERPLVAPGAYGENDRPCPGHQPARHKPEALTRGAVEPLRVVDEAKEWPLPGYVGQQAQRGESDKEAVGSVAGGQAERHPQGAS